MNNLLALRIESPALPPGRVHVAELRGVEEIGTLFELTVRVVCSDPAGLDEGAVLSHPATLLIERGGRHERSFFGVVAAVEDELLTEAHHAAYSLTFVPRAWRMSQSTGYAVFLDQCLPEIVTAKLSQAGFKAQDDFELRLLATYPKREMVIQHRESDWAFVSRLCEHAGISLFFDHMGERDVLVLSDDPSGFRPAAGQERAPFRPRGEHLGVYGLKSKTRSVPGRYVVKDYNYRTPSVSLTKTSPVSEAGSATVYEYGDHHATPDEAERIATIRAQEIAATEKVYEGESDLGRFQAGARVVLEGHARADGEYLLLRVEHHAEQGTLGGGNDVQHAYRNRFRAIPAATPFRPPRRTPRPRVLGAITGIVEAENQGQYAELDDAGRYHVRFLFDSGASARGAASSLLRMAQPHAGAGYGMHFPLRDGVEVLVTCIDGDPDRPIITGAVPNPQTPSPVGSKNTPRNVIRTGGGTEINLDDTDGSTRFKVTVPHSNTTFQLGAPNAPGDGCWIGTDKDIHHVAGDCYNVKAGETVDVDAGASINVKAEDELNLNGKRSLLWAETTLTLDADAELLGGAPNVFLFGKDGAAIGSAGLVTVAAPTTVLAGETVRIAATGSLEIEAPVVTIKADTINITDGDVNITGKDVTITSTGMIRLNK